MKKLLKKVPLLESPRFYALLFIVVVELLQTQGWLDQGAVAEILRAFELLFGGAATIRTIDKLGKR